MKVKVVMSYLIPRDVFSFSRDNAHKTEGVEIIDFLASKYPASLRAPEE